jgi:uncharacterized membrane protein YkoI
MYRYSKLSVLLISIAAGGVAYAAQSRHAADPTALARANIPLTQAATIAERQVDGRAQSARFEHGRAGWLYDVEVAHAQQVFDVLVDANKGTVLTTRAHQGAREG